MPEEVEETVQAILDDPDSTDDEDEAYAIAWDQHEGDAEKRANLAKSAPNGSVAKMEFEVQTEGSVGAIFKADDDFVIWGPASVEVVDKERDRIKAKALEDALPQLLKRKRLSYEHSDQIVGDILERFEADEPVDVEVAGQTFTRKEFPTDVLKLDGLKPGLYVAGNIYNDSQKSQEVRKQIEEGDLDSYSISGEAVVTEMAVKDGQTFTDILKLDLSAVTICSEGMNQKAKFGVVSKDEEGPTMKSSLNPQRAASIAKSRIDKTMSNDDDDTEDVQKFVDALDKTLEERLPEGELATKEDVEEMVDERLKAQEGSPKEGTPERPSGEGTAVEQDEDYEGDNPDNTASDSDKVEEKSGYTMDELKSVLPDDQFKAIEPLLEREDEEMDPLDEEPDVDPAEDRPEELVEPDTSGEMEEPPMMEPEEEDEEGEADPVLASKAVDNLNWNKLSEDQKKALAKAGSVQKADSTVRTGTGVGGGAEPAHAKDQPDQDEVAKADGDAVSGDPALRKVYDGEGKPQI